MSNRKKIKADQIKDAKKLKAFAILRNCPSSPRKMRLVADMVRGKEVNNALDLLRYSTKESSRKVEKLVLSAINNWQQKNEGKRIEDNQLYIKEIFVDEGRMLKRIQPAPQGRAHRVRKRSNHVTVVVDTIQLETEA
ncbi:MAG TPA: 50S ribosomal protein L22 [Bacteroidales bacterium]|jgi:large subunit ribosomal protein L22|nr:50S ribosomal protein L22 [Bacteroidales bacterium]